MKHLECALGKGNHIGKYILVIFLSFLASNIIGVIPLLCVVIVKAIQSGGDVAASMAALSDMSNLAALGISPNLFFVLMLIPFALALVTLIFFIKLLHGRSYKEVINGTKTVRWSRFFWGAAFWFALALISLGIQYAISPSDFELQFDITAFIPLVFISLLLIPLQTSYEELTFRGYMAQGVGALTKSRWMAFLIPSILFGLMHSFNPEVSEFGFWLMIPQYILMGAMLGLISILDDGIELAMGVHAANNIFASLFVTHSSSVFQTPAIFSIKEINPEGGYVEILITATLLIAFFYKKYNWSFSVMNKKIEVEEVEVKEETV
ncbi:membrane protease YdiL (CAAX protease family) [Dysgonomonas sp. PFB1-18]|uniref:CPBP family intramembrane glutamic endopeptidase n=1 Tax=unclassified Dysgonomonas TaxID=2630389 RepID=UPI00247315F9|nr:MULTISPECIES: CPBP family intramembrane glutamic endopeptidase [unclassified Dysgonomonas]MDH6308650.1 membrane protease YdiL (CAAX protease family) [Dysgonomonas sp. PF1-14]MDH6338151.1 membrane protease YdiL (CAAX protease family) [Dysgonomonas sp. PF1-16]MDH6379648.1 membrane protease YdiL (CAAX protease family) [Dysgonomonas sp. PFB1-18]MDH6396978.1 membrane protease YdiL (CAAX protease family) [Dysgonomonas sp. PF1-23]